MNDIDHDLENELRHFTPDAPADRLISAIEHELRVIAPRRWSTGARVSLWASWTVTAAAAAVAAVAWWPPSSTAEQNSPSAEIASESNVVPVGETNVLCDARDEGLVVLDDGRTARQVRLHYVDTLRLEDREARSSIAVSRPREEVRFVPVNFY